MNSSCSLESLASTIVALKEDVCHQPTKEDLNRIKKELRKRTESLQNKGRHILYSWEDRYNQFEINDHIKRLERRVDELDFQVEKTINANALFLSKLVQGTEANFLPEKY
ncbi:unnamed protein product [Rodentolepis nana]|uniref:CC126 protein n=1 Tax=Rodentolepis nana TaxID=102285 RepID=A0A0R3T1J2_RODNA|nr:unnamed protein product [Rodentolepis nana]